MSQASSVPPASQPGGGSAAPRTQRSPVEKVVVWGGILLLLLLVAMQARARLGYSKTLEALQDRMAEDEGSDANPLLVKDLNDYVYGWPTRKEESKGTHLSTIELTWTGLPVVSKPLGLVVGYDPQEAGGTVMALETSGFVEPEPTVAPPPFSDEQAKQLEQGPPPGAAGSEPAGDEPEPVAPPVTAPPVTAPTTEEPAADPTTPEEAPASEAAPVEEPAAETPATETPETAKPATEQPADQ